MFYIYVLWSEKLRKRYVGYTSDISKRMHEHNNGNSKFTKGGVPWKLVHREEFSSKTEAIKREIFLKSGIGRKWLDETVTECGLDN